MLRRMGLSFARFAGLVMFIVGAFIFAVNVGLVFTAEPSGGGYGPWVLPWVLGSGAAGAVGGVFYLLSIDGRERFRTKRTRSWSWAGMLAGALVPSIIAPILLLIVLLVSPTLFVLQTAKDGEEPVASY